MRGAGDSGAYRKADIRLFSDRAKNRRVRMKAILVDDDIGFCEMFLARLREEAG